MTKKINEIMWIYTWISCLILLGIGLYNSTELTIVAGILFIILFASGIIKSNIKG